MPLIGEVAYRAGVSVQTVRYYERLGILPRARRRASGYREFEPDAVALVRFIKRAQELGFTLRELCEVTRLRQSRRTDCASVREKVSEKLTLIDEKIQSLSAIREELVGLLESCGHEAPACPVLSTLERSDGQRTSPARARKRRSLSGR